MLSRRTKAAFQHPASWFFSLYFAPCEGHHSRHTLAGWMGVYTKACSSFPKSFQAKMNAATLTKRKLQIKTAVSRCSFIYLQSSSMKRIWQMMNYFKVVFELSMMVETKGHTLNDLIQTWAQFTSWFYHPFFFFFFKFTVTWRFAYFYHFTSLYVIAY